METVTFLYLNPFLPVNRILRVCNTHLNVRPSFSLKTDLMEYIKIHVFFDVLTIAIQTTNLKSQEFNLRIFTISLFTVREREP